MVKIRNLIIVFLILIIGTSLFTIEQKLSFAENMDSEAIMGSDAPVYDKSIGDRLIRFHVIANSDSEEDQKIKLVIRDAILKNFGEPLAKCKTRAESLKYIKRKLPEIEELADKILAEGGKGYKSRAMLGEFNFPIKQYGTITLPPGKYTALRVVLGEGEGKNWWCVMFPPLCFIDITSGLTTDKTDKTLGKVLSKNQIDRITSSDSNNIKRLPLNKKGNVVFKLKSVEVIKKLIDKLKK